VAQSGRINVSSSESTTSFYRLGQNKAVDSHFEKGKAVVASDSISTTSEIPPASQSVFPGEARKETTSRLGIDVETSAELQIARKGVPPTTRISKDALDPRKADLRIISFSDDAGNIQVHDLNREPLPAELRQALKNQPLICHNALFDLAALKTNGYQTSADIFCTLTASRILTAGLHDANDLGAILERHLGIKVPKELGASDFGGMFLTADQIAYCENDVKHLGAAQVALQKALAVPEDGVDLRKIAALEMALIPAVVDMRLRGIHVDRPKLEGVHAKQIRAEKQMAAELRLAFSLPKLNLQSPIQLLKAFQTVGLVLEDTNKETLSACSHELAQKLLRYRQAVGLLTTIEGWLESLDSGNRLYPPLNPLSADTGRFGCQKPNLLAVPRNKEIRSCFIPDDPDFVFVEADYSNIELRIAAHFAREERLLDMFRNGGDVHTETATHVLGDSKARQEAKTVNFGCLYGGGWERLQITARTEFGLEFSDGQAQRYHAGFFRAYPNLRKWHRAAREQADEITYGATAYGRRRWANPEDRKDQWAWNRFQLAINFEVQGTGADALKIGLIEMNQAMQDGVRIVLPIHDAALIQCPREEAVAVTECAQAIMAGAFHKILGPDFPVTVDTKISSTWGG
jgi:DNA polymerase-1